MSSPSTPLSTTRVKTARQNQNKRPSVRLKIARGKSNIVNSVVVDAAGQSLYTISSNLKRTTVVACKNNVEVATVEWDRSSPQIVLRRKKLRCKDWLPLAGPQTEYKPFLLTAFCHSELERDLSRSRILTHGDSQFTWAHRSSTCGYVCICYHLDTFLRG